MYFIREAKIGVFQLPTKIFRRNALLSANKLPFLSSRLFNFVSKGATTHRFIHPIPATPPLRQTNKQTAISCQGKEVFKNNKKQISFPRGQMAQQTTPILSK